jgi:hypothetical protein
VFESLAPKAQSLFGQGELSKGARGTPERPGSFESSERESILPTFPELYSLGDERLRGLAVNPFARLVRRWRRVIRVRFFTGCDRTAAEN